MFQHFQRGLLQAKEHLLKWLESKADHIEDEGVDSDVHYLGEWRDLMARIIRLADCDGKSAQMK